MPSFDPAKSGFSRVFMIEGRARPDHTPDFQTCLKAGSVDQSFGDIEKIECPDPERYGGFIEIGQIQGAIDRGSTTLTGKYASDLESTLLVLAKRRCAVDVQVHFGACTDPRIFNKFTKAVILENAYLTNFSTDDLGALTSDENAAVNENTDLSWKAIFEVLELVVQSRAVDLITNEVLDVVICGSIACGECGTENKGCEHIYTLQGAVTGSPGTAPDIIYSLDKGKTWDTDEVNSMFPSDAANALACLGDYVVVVSNASCSLHYKDHDDVDAGVVGGWIENTGGFVATKCPRDIWSVGYAAFIVGDGGYVYYTTDPTLDVEVLDAGVATTDILYAVHALSDEFAVAVGANGTVIRTKNRVNWSAVTDPTTQTLTGVWCKTTDEWFVTDYDGHFWYTLDGGDTWTEIALPGSPTMLDDVQMATDSVVYVVGADAYGGKAWRSYDGGRSWVVLPEGVGSLPTSNALYALAVCPDDVNFVVMVGEGATVNDGIILVGED